MFKIRMLCIGLGMMACLMGPDALAGSGLCPGSIVVVDTVTKRVLQIDQIDGTQTTISSGGSFISLFGVAVESSGDLVVVDRAAFSDTTGAGGVLRIDPLTGLQTPILIRDGLIASMGLVLGPAGEILVSNFFGDDVISIDPTTGAHTSLTADGFLAGPMGMALRSDGELFIADNDGSSIVQANITTGVQTQVTINGLLQGPSDIAIEDSGMLVVADFNSGRIVRVNPDTGQQSLVTSGFNLPYGITVEADGNLLVTDHTTFFPQMGRIVRVNPGTGSKTVLSTDGFLGFPAGIITIPYSPADFNHNGAVDILDLISLINAFGPCAGCPEDFVPPGGDGDVSITDLIALINAFGPCP